MAFPFFCCPVVRYFSWKKTQIEKKFWCQFSFLPVIYIHITRKHKGNSIWGIFESSKNKFNTNSITVTLMKPDILRRYEGKGILFTLSSHVLCYSKKGYVSLIGLIIRRSRPEIFLKRGLLKNLQESQRSISKGDFFSNVAVCLLTGLVCNFTKRWNTNQYGVRQVRLDHKI